jgi:hypothetical protein
MAIKTLLEFYYEKNTKHLFSPDLYSYTGCLKKDAMEIQQAVVHHKRG